MKGIRSLLRFRKTWQDQASQTLASGHVNSRYNSRVWLRRSLNVKEIMSVFKERESSVDIYLFVNPPGNDVASR